MEWNDYVLHGNVHHVQQREGNSGKKTINTSPALKTDMVKLLEFWRFVLQIQIQADFRLYWYINVSIPEDTAKPMWERIKCCKAHNARKTQMPPPKNKFAFQHWLVQTKKLVCIYIYIYIYMFLVQGLFYVWKLTVLTYQHVIVSTYNNNLDFFLIWAWEFCIARPKYWCLATVLLLFLLLPLLLLLLFLSLLLLLPPRSSCDSVFACSIMFMFSFVFHFMIILHVNVLCRIIIITFVASCRLLVDIIYGKIHLDVFSVMYQFGCCNVDVEAFVCRLKC